MPGAGHRLCAGLTAAAGPAAPPVLAREFDHIGIDLLPPASPQRPRNGSSGGTGLPARGAARLELRCVDPALLSESPPRKPDTGESRAQSREPQPAERRNSETRKSESGAQTSPVSATSWLWCHSCGCHRFGCGSSGCHCSSRSHRSSHSWSFSRSWSSGRRWRAAGPADPRPLAARRPLRATPACSARFGAVRMRQRRVSESTGHHFH